MAAKSLLPTAPTVGAAEPVLVATTARAVADNAAVSASAPKIARFRRAT